MNRFGGLQPVHAGLHGEDAGRHPLSADTAAASAIALADWFVIEQLRILARGRYAARRAKRDEVFALLADNPKGIKQHGTFTGRGLSVQRG